MSERLPPQPGEWIDRSRPLEFRFEGQRLRGCAGDAVASALLANGVSVLGRSFKYHRPRGLVSLAGHDANALFTDGVRTNLRGAGTPLEAGMELRAVNTVGGVRRDRLRWLERMARFMPVGFYYKAFHRPRWLFPWFERAARRLAGLGRINREAPPAAAAGAYAWCDVLVVGGGPAGLEAALAAGRAGAKVLLVEEQPRLGGSLGWQHGACADARAALEELCRELAALENVEIRCGTTAGGHYADHWVALFDAHRMTRVRARAVVYATGAIEQPAVFGNNDLPGVLLGSACQQLVRWYAVRPGRRTVVLAANRDAYRVALDLRAAGTEVVLIADLRPDGEPSALGGEAQAAGIPVLAACTVYEAQAEPRTGCVQSALVARLGVAPAPGSGAAGREVDLGWRARIACDTIVLSVGWTPNAVLPSQAGVRFRYDEERAQLLPDAAPEGVYLAGRVRGVYELAAQREDGRGAGLRRRRGGRSAATNRTRHKCPWTAGASPNPCSRVRDTRMRTVAKPIRSNGPASGLRECGAGAGTPGRRAAQPSLSHLRASGAQELRRPGRGPAPRGPGQRPPGGVRQRRVAQALQHGGHGPEPGQAGQPQRGAGRGAAQRPFHGADRQHHRASLLPAGAAGPPGGPAPPPDAPHAVPRLA